MEHGCDAGLHCGPKAFYFAILCLSVGGREALEDAESVAGSGCGAFGENRFGVGLQYLDLGVVASEEKHLGLVLLYRCGCLPFTCGGITDNVG